MQNDNKTQAKKARVKGNPNFYVHLIIVFSLFFPALSLAATSLTLKAGWNLMGNGSSSSIDVATTFGDSEKISTVWKWNRGTSRWAFYAPSMNSDLLSTYAQNKGYDRLSSIDSKEGFWVNAVTNAVAAAPAANGANLSVADIQVGWNLVSSADAQTPSQLNAFRSWQAASMLLAKRSSQLGRGNLLHLSGVFMRLHLSRKAGLC